MKLKSIAMKIIIPIFISIIIFAGFISLSPKTVHVNASFTMIKDFDTLLSKADTIVVGNVINVDKGFAIDRNNYIVGEEIQKIISKKGKHLSVYTPSKIKIEQVIKGNLSVGDMIRINQQGGIYENTFYKIGDNEIYKDKQSYVFFLKKGNLESEQSKKDFKENFYLPINPFQGQLSIENNIVQTNTEINPMYDRDTMSLEEFVELIKSNLD